MTTTEPDLSNVYDDDAVTDETIPSSLFETENDDSDKGTPGERQPTERKQPRTPTSSLVTMIVGGAGTALIRSNYDVPVGRVLQFEAPLFGNKVDELIAHTWLDVLLQPIVKQAEKIEGLGAIVL